MDYTLAHGQVYALGRADPSDDSTLEIEIVHVLQGEQARVTFAVYELYPGSSIRTHQGSATVPASWLSATLAAHRAYLLTDRTGDNDRAEYPDPIVDRPEHAQNRTGKCLMCDNETGPGRLYCSSRCWSRAWQH